MTETKVKGLCLTSWCSTYPKNERSYEKTFNDYPATKVLREICDVGEGAEEFMEKLTSQRSYSAKDVVRIISYIFKNPNKISFEWFLGHFFENPKFPNFSSIIQTIINNYEFDTQGIKEGRFGEDNWHVENEQRRRNWIIQTFDAFQLGFDFKPYPEMSAIEKCDHWWNFKKHCEYSWDIKHEKDYTHVELSYAKFKERILLQQALKILEEEGVESTKLFLESNIKQRKGTYNVDKN